MSRHQTQSGFTAVELLITLFVAAAFLIASYQLFSVVVNDGGQARAESRASNVAYDYLRQYTSSAANPCVEYTPLSDSTLSVDGLSDTTVTVTITCPDYSTDELSKVEVTVSYNDPQQTVKYGTYTSGSDGTPNGEIINGLVGWWKLNGNANSSIGNLNGTTFNVTPRTGQDNIANHAYSFNGSSSYIDVGDSDALTLGNFSLSLWLKTSITSAQRLLNKETSGQSSYGLLINNSMLYFFVDGTWGSHYIRDTGPVVTDDVWHHVLASRSESTLYLYIDGQLIATRPNSTTETLDNNTNLLFGKHYTSIQWLNGSMDDVRIYNRALTSTEISTLYSRGAQ